MKYNKAFQGEPFEVYAEYLKKIQDKLPKQLYDFISDSKRHDLEEQSLHDTWLNEISVKIKRDKDNRNRAIETSIKSNFWVHITTEFFNCISLMFFLTNFKTTIILNAIY